MSKVIRIDDNLYARLGNHAKPFETPSSVIERILNENEGTPDEEAKESLIHANDLTHSNIEQVVIVYTDDSIGPVSESAFKSLLLEKRQADIEIYYADGKILQKTWNALKFSQSSNVEANLRSGYLRNWKKKGITKIIAKVPR